MNIQKLSFLIGGSVILAVFSRSTLMHNTYQAASENTGVAVCSDSNTAPSVQPLGEIYYVSKLGNDSNSGGKASPFLTIQAALDQAGPGDTIYICAGQYDAFTVDNKAGTESRPITIAAYPGQANTVTISTSTYESGAAAKIVDSSNIQIRGLTFTKSLWGIYGTRSENITIEDNVVQDIGQEAVHFRGDSRNIKILENHISDTGKRQGFSQYGEGIYLGAGRPDYPGEGVTAVLVRGNTIARTSAEAIDIKPFARDILVEANNIYDIHTLRSGAIVAGINSSDESDFTDPNTVIIQENTIRNISSASQWRDGNAIKVQSSSTIRANRIADFEHRGIFIEKARSDNRFMIEDNILCLSDRSSNMEDIVVEKTDAHIAMSNNITESDQCSR